MIIYLDNRKLATVTILSNGVCPLTEYGKSKAVLLLNTLWILLVLSLIALSLGYRMSLELRLVRHHISQVKNLYAAKAGIMQAIEILKADTTPQDHLNEDWANNPDKFKEIYVDNDVSFTISYVFDVIDEVPLIYYGLVDKERKINLNMDNLDELERRLKRLSDIVPLITAEDIDSILDWRDPDDNPRLFGAEKDDDYYRNLAYKPRNGKFKVMDELLLVKGFNKEKVEKLQKFLTIYGNIGGEVNINTCSREVLVAVGLTPREADIIIRYRHQILEDPYDDRFFIKSTLEPTLRWLIPGIMDEVINNFTVSSNFFQINIVGEIARLNSKKSVSIIYDRNIDKVIYWQED